MAINYDIEVRDGCLCVKTSGFAESLEEHMAYAHAAYDAMINAGCSEILIDEWEMEYRLGTFDIYKLAEDVANSAEVPMRVAVVTNPENNIDARFFEDVVSNRGFKLLYFKTLDEAHAWLKS